jgi:hypothetical protein
MPVTDLEADRIKQAKAIVKEHTNAIHVHEESYRYPQFSEDRAPRTL